MSGSKIVGITLAAALLGGCIIVTDGDSEYDGDRSAWRQRQDDNRDYIAELRLGAAMDGVHAALGSPDFSEGWTDETGREVVVLRYRTHHSHSDGDTTRDETTPLMFVGGRLAAWGDAVAVEPASGRAY